LFIDDTPNLSTLELRSKVYGFEQEYGVIDLVVIDYMQLMAGSERENRQQQVSLISRELKGLAKEMNVPVVALSQLSRAPEARNPPKPLMSDLRESGSIEQDADVVAFMYREDYYNETEDNKGVAQVIFSKQRNGGTGEIDLAFLKEFSRFETLHQFEPRIKLQ
jgi:replicative DNA helicase